MASSTIPHRFSRRFLWAGYLIGFALGGFFDGILLHQILQWHHLLSAVQSSALDDLRIQVMADGVFHGLMYLVAATGLTFLYRARSDFTGAAADRNLLADVLLGFGIWHIVDAVVFHWLTGIHHIRMDTANPIAWDTTWLVLFGLIPMLAGLRVKRNYPRVACLTDRRRTRHGFAIAIAAFTVAGSFWASLPSPASGAATIVVVLRPGVDAGRFLRSLTDPDAKIVGSDRAGAVWVLRSAGSRSSFDYYRSGALYVSGTVLPAGCSAWFARSY
jgi:uncharacterized membrane protein